MSPRGPSLLPNNLLCCLCGILESLITHGRSLNLVTSLALSPLLQVLLPLVPLLSPAVLLSLFSHSSAHRVSILTLLHAQLLPSLPHDAISVPLAAASSPPPRLPIAISAPSPFSPGDMKVFYHNAVKQQVVEVLVTFLAFGSMICYISRVRLYAT